MIQTIQRVSFASVAGILFPLGVTILNQNLVGGIIIIAFAIGALIAREVFKSV